MKKRIFSLVLGILLIFTVCLAPFPANAVSRDTTTIRIVHTNDIHGYYTNTENGQIGFSALKALIDRQDADLVLDAGDTFHGQAFATVEQGASIAELMDSVGYDAMTPGNHDWSYGKDHLKELDTQTDFPILAANVIRADGSAFFQTPYLIKEVAADDGTPIKVGVFGVIDDALYSSTPPANVEGLTFTEEAAKATEIAQLLREKEKCDIVLCLTHQTDCEGFVAATMGIDAVIAGHEHKLIDEEYKDLSGNTVPVVEAGYYFQNVGILSITLNKTDGTVKTESTFLTAENTASLSDEGVSNLIAAIEERENGKLDQPVGMGTQEYPYSWEEIRTSDQAIGRIVANAYLDATGADIAFENAGGIRGGLPAGDITYRDIIGISPYGNILVTRELTGQQVLNILEHSIELSIQCNAVYDLQKEAVANGEDPYQYTWPDNSGSVLQVSGIQVRYDPSKPAGRPDSPCRCGRKAAGNRAYLCRCDKQLCRYRQ